MPFMHQPQRKFVLALFTIISCLRGRINFRNLSRYSDYSERTFHRQFRQEFDFPEFNRLSIKQVVDPASTLLIAQDATFIPKSGKHSYGLARFFNGCTHRVERGLEASTVAIVDVPRSTAFTLSVKQTPPRPNLASPSKRPTGQHLDSSIETRMDFYLEHFCSCLPYLPDETTKLLLVDGAFARYKFVEGVCLQGCHLITKLRVDANLRFLHTGPQRAGRGRKRQFSGKVSFSDLSRFNFCGEVEPGLALYAQVVNSVTLKRTVRVVVVVDKRTRDKPRYVVLCSTNCELAAELIFDYYAARFSIEFLFRDAKQFTGLTECQARDQKALHFHFNAALSAVNIAKIEQIQQSTSATAQVFSLASYKQRAFNEHLLELFISKLALKADMIKNHPQYNYLRNYGAIAA
jgi:hypothetical protein